MWAVWAYVVCEGLLGEFMGWSKKSRFMRHSREMCILQWS